jgi:hypothetical protein
MLAHRGAAVGACLALLALGLGLSRVIGTGFLPEMDEGGFILDYWAPTGAALSETDRQVRVLEGILLADPAVQAFTRRTGSELGLAATSPNRGDFTVLLKPRGARQSVYEVMDRVRSLSEERAPAVRVEFVQLMQDVIGDLPARRAGRAQAVQRTRPPRRAARAVRSDRADAGWWTFRRRQPRAPGGADPANARLGLTASEVEAQARAALFGADASTARAGPLVPSACGWPTACAPRRRHRALKSSGPAAGFLGQLGRCATPAARALRENLRPYVAVTGDQRPQSRRRDGRRGGHWSGGAAGGRRCNRRALRQPAGRVSRALLGARTPQPVGAAAVGAVRGFRGPLNVLAVPLGVTGALMMLATGFLQRLEPHGTDPARGADREERHPAARRRPPRVRCGRGASGGAGARRPGQLRPILMTPYAPWRPGPLSLGLGAGAELQRPLALAVVGGLVVSTLVTLLIMPVFLETSRTSP